MARCSKCKKYSFLGLSLGVNGLCPACLKSERDAFLAHECKELCAQMEQIHKYLDLILTDPQNKSAHLYNAKAVYKNITPQRRNIAIEHFTSQIILVEERIELFDREINSRSVNLTPEKSTSVWGTYTSLAGVTFTNENGNDIQSILSNIPDGSSLDFIRDPNNPYDSNAIRVYYGNERIGYINRELAADVAPQIDTGKVLSGCVSEITGGRDSALGCNVHITLT